MKTYPFSALFSRMKYITRWCLMRSTRQESLSEHTADTAMLAHTLCLIGRHCTGTGAALRPEVVATAAIYHDAPEILTGDMPTPVKYKNDALRTAYKAVEHESARVMASLQPEGAARDPGLADRQRAERRRAQNFKGRGPAFRRHQVH